MVLGLTVDSGLASGLAHIVLEAKGLHPSPSRAAGGDFVRPEQPVNRALARFWGRKLLCRSAGTRNNRPCSLQSKPAGRCAWRALQAVLFGSGHNIRLQLAKLRLLLACLLHVIGTVVDLKPATQPSGNAK